MNVIKNFTKNIKNYTKIKKTSNTHNISHHHERYVVSKIIESFNAQEISSIHFKEIINTNNYKLVSKPKKDTDIIEYCPGLLKINNDIKILDILKKNKTFVVHQPAGSQEYPDIIIGTYCDKKLLLSYIECKQDKPTFNNNPPKNNPNCIYICGYKIYSGMILINNSYVKKIKNFKKDYKSLCSNMSDNIIRFVPYKKIELKWGSDGPPLSYDYKLNNMYIKESLLKHK